MIKNDVQYKVTKAQADRFEKALRDLRERAPERFAKNPKLRDVYEASIKSQLEELREQLAEYDALRSGSGARLELSSFDEVPKVLVQARIASGLSQRDLAERLSMKEQQIQRYEATEYASASLTRLKQIALALGLQVKEPAVFKPIRHGAKPRHATSAKRARTTRRRVTAKAARGTVGKRRQPAARKAVAKKAAGGRRVKSKASRR